MLNDNNEIMEISKLTITAGNIASVFDNINNGLDNGLINGTEVTAFIKIFEKQIAKVKDKARDKALQEIGEEKYTVYGISLKKQNGARYYDFSNSPDWNEIDKKKKDIEAHLKIGEWINPETGELNPKAIEKFRADSIVTK
jgi:hypothetical protein